MKLKRKVVENSVKENVIQSPTPVVAEEEKPKILEVIDTAPCAIDSLIVRANEIARESNDYMVKIDIRIITLSRCHKKLF